MTRILVTGSRGWTNEATIQIALAYFAIGPFETLPVLVHGAAEGADTIAAEFWRSLGLPDEPHPPNYERYNKKQAPIIRNAQMVQLGANYCVAFMLNDSRGTTHCVNLAKKAGIPTTIYRETRKCQNIVKSQSKSKPGTTSPTLTPTRPPTSSHGAAPTSKSTTTANISAPSASKAEFPGS